MSPVFMSHIGIYFHFHFETKIRIGKKEVRDKIEGRERLK